MIYSKFKPRDHRTIFDPTTDDAYTSAPRRFGLNSYAALTIAVVLVGIGEFVFRRGYTIAQQSRGYDVLDGIGWLVVGGALLLSAAIPLGFSRSGLLQTIGLLMFAIAAIVWY